MKNKIKGKLFKGIIAILVCIAIIFGVAFALSFSELQYKNLISEGNYESPYISRPMEKITVNGVSIEELSVVVSSEDEVYTLASDTLCEELYTCCGKSLQSAKEDGKNTFVIEKKLYSEDKFTLTVKNGKVYIKGSESTGISRGITSFVNEVLLKSEGSFDFMDGYEYTKSFENYVTYEEFGAVGDGKTDDFEAIIKAHEYANEKGLSVFAKEAATYYIGGKDATAVIKTNTDWSTARFIIDDTKVENRSAWVFEVSPSEAEYDVTQKLSPLKADAENIGTTLEGKSLIVLTDSNVKRYIRKGANQNSGSDQTDVIIVNEDGTISPDAPLIWDFDHITGAAAYPIDTQKLTVTGGVFTTIANRDASEYNYYSRGIAVRRSNTDIEGICHYIEGEGETGAPYSAFVSVSRCADVQVKNCTFTGHKKYFTTGSAGTSVAMGTYDVNAATAVNVSFVNCKQTNDITDIDYWGIAGSNYCKNLVYDGCALSRYDAHQGVLNATVKNSVMGHHGIKLIGHGKILIENTTVLSDSFIDFREDYGSSWKGELVIRNCKFYPTTISNHILKAVNSESHDFGYECHLPEKIEIDGLVVHRMGNSYLFNNVNKEHKGDSYKAEYPVATPSQITVKDFKSHIFGKLYVSKNDSMFKTEIENK